MSNFKEYILKPLKNTLDTKSTTTCIPILTAGHFDKFNKITGDIERGKVIGIGGRDSSGKKSFMDQVYLFNILMWWHNFPPNSRPKIKIHYFNLGLSTSKKLQKWLCLYLKLKYDVIIDIPTLLQNKGKLYDLNTRPEVVTCINQAQEFFDDIEEVLSLYTGRYSPTEIGAKVMDYLKTISIIEEGKVTYNLGYENIWHFVFIDNTEVLANEHNGYVNVTGVELKKSLAEEVFKLSNKYKISFILNIPSTFKNVGRNPRETEPTYKEFGIFSSILDVGVVMYNPYMENNLGYLNFPIRDMVINNNNRFRSLSVVRNTAGLESIVIGLIFLGECGYFRESPRPDEKEVFHKYIELLRGT
jgi:hypothetical protein